MRYNLKEFRENKGLTQVELGIKSGISRATIARIESGDEISVSTDTLFKLADALECRVSDIFLP